jgi:hypothetical protein
MAMKNKSLDDCVSAFYEDNIDEKSKAAKQILEYFQDFSRLEELLSHGIPYITQNPCCKFSVELYHKTIIEALI